MNILILDVETSIKNKGNPFTQGNKCVVVGLKWLNQKANIIYLPCSNWNFDYIQGTINHADLVVGFNIKFDLHWIRNIGIDISHIKVWDCQLAEFILSNQSTPYPSLDGTASKYGLGSKLDIVKTEYWDKGIDTDQIPRPILTEYLEQDLDLTQAVYERQSELLGSSPLFRLHCQDLLVLEDMEYSGILFNTERALEKSTEIDNELKTIRVSINDFLGGIFFNPNSNDHVSAALYGGTISESLRIPIGVYQTGAKVGQPRYKLVEKKYELKRLCEPIKGTETKKHTTECPSYEVNETVLRKLKLSKGAKQFVSLLQRYSELEKLSGTYLKGYAKLIKEMDWPKGWLHPTFNQCVARTGRLTSSKPNGQNVDPITKAFMETRYNEI